MQVEKTDVDKFHGGDAVPMCDFCARWTGEEDELLPPVKLQFIGAKLPDNFCTLNMSTSKKCFIWGGGVTGSGRDVALKPTFSNLRWNHINQAFSNHVHVMYVHDVLMELTWVYQMGRQEGIRNCSLYAFVNQYNVNCYLAIESQQSNTSGGLGDMDAGAGIAIGMLCVCNMTTAMQ